VLGALLDHLADEDPLDSRRGVASQRAVRRHAGAPHAGVGGDPDG